MRGNLLRTVLAASVGIASLALAVPATAQTLNHWRNADTSHGNFYVGVSGGPQCNHVGCGLHNGTSIIAYQAGQFDQMWYDNGGDGPVQDYYYNIDNGLNMCLGVAGGKLNQGQPLVIWQCNGAKDQSWKVVPAESLFAPATFNGCFVFFNDNSGMAMGVSGGTMKNGTQIIQWPLFQGPWHPDQFWCPN